MKKALLSLLTAMAMVGFAASCSSDDAPVVAEANETAVTFTAELADETMSRAGEGNAVDRLQWVIFDQTGTPLRYGVKTDAFIAGHAEVTISLIENREYTVGFFADDSASPYTVEIGTAGVPTGNIKADYTTASANSEALDAFYSTVKVTGGTSSVPVKLIRPFAQVNVGTADYSEATPVATSALTLTGEFYTSMSLLDGSVANRVETLTFAAAALPQESLTVSGRSFTYLAYAYVLPTASGSLIKDLTITFPESSRSFTDLNLPVKRNNRSNLAGNIFSSDSDFNTDLDPGFDKPWDGTTLTEVQPAMREINGAEIEVYAVSAPAQLAWCAQNVTDGYVILDADISMNNKPFTAFGDCSRSDAAGARFKGIFDGNGKVITDLAPIDHNSDNWGSALIAVAEDATVKNVTVKDSEIIDSGDFAGAIMGTAFGETTIENCHAVNINVRAGDKAGGILGRAYGTNVLIKNCSVSGTVSGKAAGGIVGTGAQTKGYNTTLSGCVNKARVYALQCGGMAGFMGHPVIMTDCTNNGTIGISTNTYTGGMIGYFTNQTAETSASFTGCVNTGTIIGAAASGMLGILRMERDCTLVFADCANSGTLYTSDSYTVNGNAQIMASSLTDYDSKTTVTNWTATGEIKALSDAPTN